MVPRHSFHPVSFSGYVILFASLTMRSFVLIGKVSSLCGHLQHAIVRAMEVSIEAAILLSVGKRDQRDRCAYNTIRLLLEVLHCPLTELENMGDCGGQRAGT